MHRKTNSAWISSDGKISSEPALFLVNKIVWTGNVCLEDCLDDPLRMLYILECRRHNEHPLPKIEDALDNYSMSVETLKLLPGHCILSQASSPD